MEQDVLPTEHYAVLTRLLAQQQQRFCEFSAQYKRQHDLFVDCYQKAAYLGSEQKSPDPKQQRDVEKAIAAEQHEGDVQRLKGYELCKDYAVELSVWFEQLGEALAAVPRPPAQGWIERIGTPQNEAQRNAHFALHTLERLVATSNHAQIGAAFQKDLPIYAAAVREKHLIADGVADLRCQAKLLPDERAGIEDELRRIGEVRTRVLNVLMTLGAHEGQLYKNFEELGETLEATQVTMDYAERRAAPHADEPRGVGGR